MIFFPYLFFPSFLCTQMLHILIRHLLLQNVSISEYIYVIPIKLRGVNILDTKYVSNISS